MVQEIDPLMHIYAAIGDAEPYYRLVDNFYTRVEDDKPLRAIYPPDLGPGKKYLTLFLIQRTGGPGTYSEERGHPRMRARHMPFRIGVKERNGWIQHMTAALEDTPEFASHKANLLEFFDGFATFMINQPD